ncbi:hypothetical protein DH2020_047091 [Rehmannia glutinosa]|uniref:Uncharacterized protein n=1 Tax=Rehmannia glutinosa TaxID=99300 RepID=A0ABR0U9X2_REHGL
MEVSSGLSPRHSSNALHAEKEEENVSPDLENLELETVVRDFGSDYHFHSMSALEILRETVRILRYNSTGFMAIAAVLICPVSPLCATPSITYSTFTAFYGKPVKFVSSLKSILVSFFPLLATLFVTEIILGLIIFAFALLMLVAYNGLVLLGVEMDYDSEYFLVFVTVIAVFLVGLLVYLLVEWCLSNAVVVLESKWGFAPLKRSSYLVKGMRKVAVSIMVFFGILSGLSSMWYSNLIANAGGSSKGWIIVQMVVYVVFSTVLSLYSMAANTVLFVHCKASHGETALQIDEEMGGEYVRLATDGVNVV